ncbi:MAG: hypothetical protein HKO59_06435 [Phycisphaerales bacterium]|nr:hypothetical protein [Phycisphaerae bacterium]NNF43033.1 hypothetical protein [Phycisphaerales bacterium]NNM25612.1 hypothetical protein [Phycisphaerales bacterium]
MNTPHRLVFGGLGALALFVGTTAAADEPLVRQDEQGRVHAGGAVWETYGAFSQSDFFREHGLRCGTPASDPGVADGGGGGDCSAFSTNPASIYAPGVARYRIPVVVHVIRNSAGSLGHIPASLVESQIEVLNEDFLALPGTLGQNGTDTQIEFYLATEDPSGAATTGITYHNNTTWYNDAGAYWVSLAWDPDRYLNIYTNNASGALGYVPYLPQSGLAGQSSDRVVIYWAAFGDFAPIGPPYHRGRTTTHEVGHYLGLEHVFVTCGSAASCYTTGDLICDTARQSSPTIGCSGGSSCGEPDSFRNYLDYTNDICMTNFTPEQARRMRCTLEHWRPDAYEIVVDCPTDIDGTGATDFTDLLVMISSWGPCPGCPADVDGNGTVDFLDLLALLSAWGPCV